MNKTEWWHSLIVHRPKELAHDTALLIIGGGSNREDRPLKIDGNIAQVANTTKSIAVELKQVPNQPLIFGDDGVERYEDDLIAYGWDKHLRGGHDEWLARLPMTKSAVRAMDTVTDFLGRKEQGELKIDKFVVAGASKRGWTTWITAIADKRVVAIAPIVIDMLNVVPSFKHHWEVYGFYAPAVDDYVNHRIMDRQDTEEYQRLIKTVEPYEYRDRLALPKLMINATEDQFFLPDSHRFYFDDLIGPKYLRYVPNADHSLDDTDAIETLATWQYIITNKMPLPQFAWSIDWETGAITIRLKDQPEKVLLWQASNPKARDFRQETIGKVWQRSPLSVGSAGNVLAVVKKPEKGWTAFMVELTYRIEGAAARLKLTTGVAVVPDIKPFVGKRLELNPNR